MSSMIRRLDMWGVVNRKKPEMFLGGVFLINGKLEIEYDSYDGGPFNCQNKLDSEFVAKALNKLAKSNNFKTIQFKDPLTLIEPVPNDYHNTYLEFFDSDNILLKLQWCFVIETELLEYLLKTRRFIDRVKEKYNNGFVGLFKLYGKQLCDDFMRNPEAFSFDKENVLSFDSTDSTNLIGCGIDTLSILAYNTLDKMIELEKTTIFPAVVFDISQMKFVNVSTNLKWKYITEQANEYLRNKNYE